jgi:hypothetical protein
MFSVKGELVLDPFLGSRNNNKNYNSKREEQYRIRSRPKLVTFITKKTENHSKETIVKIIKREKN